MNRHAPLKQPTVWAASIAVLGLLMVAAGCGSDSAQSQRRSVNVGAVIDVAAPPFKLAPMDQPLVARGQGSTFVAAVVHDDLQGSPTSIDVAMYEPTANSWSNATTLKANGYFDGAALVSFSDSVALIGHECPAGAHGDLGCPTASNVTGWAASSNGSWQALPQLGPSQSPLLKNPGDEGASVGFRGGQDVVVEITIDGSNPELWRISGPGDSWQSIAPPPVTRGPICEEGSGRLVAFGQPPGETQPPAASSGTYENPSTTSGSEPAPSVVVPSTSSTTTVAPTPQSLTAATLEPGSGEWQPVSGSAPMTASLEGSCGPTTAAAVGFGRVSTVADREPLATSSIPVTAADRLRNLGPLDGSTATDPAVMLAGVPSTRTGPAPTKIVVTQGAVPGITSVALPGGVYAEAGAINDKSEVLIASHNVAADTTVFDLTRLG